MVGGVVGSTQKGWLLGGVVGSTQKGWLLGKRRVVGRVEIFGFVMSQ